MQTFSNMQRSFPYKKNITYTLIFLVALIYESISSIYIYIPPLFGLAFIIFLKAFEREDMLALFYIFIYLIMFELNRGFLPFTSIIFFLFSIYVVVPKIKSYINCYKCILHYMVFYAYFGFFILTKIIEILFNIDVPNMSIAILFYAILEFIIVVISL